MVGRQTDGGRGAGKSVACVARHVYGASSGLSRRWSGLVVVVVVGGAAGVTGAVPARAGLDRMARQHAAA